MSKGLSYYYSGTHGDIVAVASSLPNDPSDLIGNGWTDITHPDAQGTGHVMLQNDESGLRIRFDEGKPGAPGFRGQNHYHILNPDATSARDEYLDENGNPVGRNSKESHILPKRGK